MARTEFLMALYIACEPVKKIPCRLMIFFERFSYENSETAKNCDLGYCYASLSQP